MQNFIQNFYSKDFFAFLSGLGSKVGKKCSFSFFKNSQKFQKVAFYAAFKIVGK
jgi:hypothetical protein